MSVHGEILRSEWGRALRIVPRRPPHDRFPID
jgi:hypothetical protein